MDKKKKETESYLSEVLDKLKEHKMAMVGLIVILTTKTTFVHPVRVNNS